MAINKLDVIRTAILEGKLENMTDYDIAVRVAVKLQDFNYKIVKMSNADQARWAEKNTMIA